MLKKLVISALSFGMLGASSLGGLTTAQAEENKLVISTFGLSQDQVEAVVMDPFAKANAAEVVLEVGNASERLTKLKNDPNSTIDVIELSQSNADHGVKESLFAPITEKEVPNIANLTDGAKEVFERGTGVPYAVNSIGIVYDKEALGFEIKEWADLWKPELAGTIAIPEISTTFGPAMLYLASDYKKVELESDKGEAAFVGLAELAPNIVKTYSKSSELANMFQAGEIKVAILADFAYGMVKEANPNVEYVVPESGTYANYNVINVPTNAQNKELAYKYIDWRISEELLVQTAEAFNEAPVNKNVELSEEVAAHKTYGAVAERAKTMNTQFINENMAEWLNLWNETLN